jgi:hypothetical protein
MAPLQGSLRDAEDGGQACKFYLEFCVIFFAEVTQFLLERA